MKTGLMLTTRSGSRDTITNLMTNENWVNSQAHWINQPNCGQDMGELLRYVIVFGDESIAMGLQRHAIKPSN
jgi:hypothetical protein